MGEDVAGHPADLSKQPSVCGELGCGARCVRVQVDTGEANRTAVAKGPAGDLAQGVAATRADIEDGDGLPLWDGGQCLAKKLERRSVGQQKPVKLRQVADGV